MKSFIERILVAVRTTNLVFKCMNKAEVLKPAWTSFINLLTGSPVISFCETSDSDRGSSSSRTTTNMAVSIVSKDLEFVGSENKPIILENLFFLPSCYYPVCRSVFKVSKLLSTPQIAQLYIYHLTEAIFFIHPKYLNQITLTIK